MEKPFAAGIIPYTEFKGKTYFLLGLERSNNKWSGFVGGSEQGETPRQTAIREFNEETAMIFKYNGNLANPPIIEKTTTGKTVYLWFVRFPYLMNYSQFYINQQLLNDRHYKEKSELRWFSLSEIENGKVLYILKKTILRNFF